MKSKYLLSIDGNFVAISGNFRKLYKLAADELKNGKAITANITNEAKQCDFFLYWTPTKIKAKSK